MKGSRWVKTKVDSFMKLFDSSGNKGVMSRWNPGEADHRYTRDEAAKARRLSRDAHRNQELPRAFTEKLIKGVFGRSGLQCVAVGPEGVDQRVLTAIEDRWKYFCEEAAPHHLDTFLESQLRSYILDGESFRQDVLLSEVPINQSSRIRVKAIEPWRVENRDHKPNTDTMIDGIQITSLNFPVKYHIWTEKNGAKQWKEYRKRRYGFQVLNHRIDTPVFTNQIRGVPRWAVALRSLKARSSYSEFELERKDTHARIAGVMDSTKLRDNFDPENVDEIPKLDMNAAEHGFFLVPGGEDTFKTNIPTDTGQAYPSYMNTSGLEISASLGLPYAFVRSDYPGTYTASRAMRLDAEDCITWERRGFVRDEIMSLFRLFIHDEWARGLELPGYHDPLIRRIYQNPIFKGTKLPEIDTLKLVKAYEILNKLHAASITEISELFTGQPLKEKQRILDEETQEESA